MHLHQVLKIEISVFSISYTVMHIHPPTFEVCSMGVAWPLFFYTPLVIPCTVTSVFGCFNRVSTSSPDPNNLLRCPGTRESAV